MSAVVIASQHTLISMVRLKKGRSEKLTSRTDYSATAVKMSSIVTSRVTRNFKAYKGFLGVCGSYLNPEP